MARVRPVNTTYEPFSNEPEYTEANRGFVSRQDLGTVRRILDLACGTGTVSALLLGEAPQAHLNGVDADPEQIHIATRFFTERGYEVRQGFELTDEQHDGKPVLVFGIGSVMELPFADQAFDCVTITNAIHLMPDRQAFLREAHRVLQPGGLFGFNSVFYHGAYPPGTERHALDWIKEAVVYLERKNASLRAQGKPTIRRVTGSSRPSLENRWQTPGQWCAMLEEAGFKPHDVHERRVNLDERCLAAIGAYGGLAEMVMSGYPVAEASEALQATAGTVLTRMGVETLPRNWLEVWSRRT